MKKGPENKENILVVDDEEDVRNFLKNLLMRKGFNVTMAADGEEALAHIKNSNIHIVLSDIAMPKFNGVELLKHVHEFNSSVEVIMLTGQSTLENCVECLEKGACAFLIKPVGIEEILEAIARAQRNIHEKQEMINKILKLHRGGAEKEV